RAQGAFDDVLEFRVGALGGEFHRAGAGVASERAVITEDEQVHAVGAGRSLGEAEQGRGAAAELKRDTDLAVRYRTDAMETAGQLGGAGASGRTQVRPPGTDVGLFRTEDRVANEAYLADAGYSGPPGAGEVDRGSGWGKAIRRAARAGAGGGNPRR